MLPFAAGLWLRVLTLVAVQFLHGNFLFLDDQGYDRTGWILAQDWRMHYFPPPASVAITASWFYYVFVAAVYYVFGHHWVVVKLIGALLSALSVPCATSVGISLGGRRLGLRAAWLAALYPSAVFWGSAGIKDGPMAALLLAVAATALQPLTMRRLAAAASLVVVAFLARPVLGVVCTAMLVVPALSLLRGGLPPAQELLSSAPRVVVLLAGIPSAAWLIAHEAARYLPELTASLAGTPQFSLGGAPSAANFAPHPADVVHALLSPVRWFGPATSPGYVPGMMVWTAMLPVTALGCWDLLRRGSPAARGIIVSALGFLYLYSCVFEAAGFSRQRFTVEVLFLIAGLHAFGRFPGRAAAWTALAACAVTLAELALSLALPVTFLGAGMTACGAAAVTVCLARRPVRDWRARAGQEAGS